MALTVTNTNTIQLLNILNANTLAQARTTRQLSTGKRINSGADDPAGLIALSGLNAELRAVSASLINNQRTDSLLNVADQAIAEVSNLLGEIQTLVQASTSEANLTASEIAANQSQIDDALTAIDRIVNTTNFNGKKLLDGAFAIQATGIDVARITNLRIFSRSQVTTNTLLNIDRITSAQVASVALQGTGAAAAVTTSGSTSLAITGNLGTATITLSDQQTLTQVRDAINLSTSQTGVVAVLSTNATGPALTGIRLDSSTFGSDAFVSVSVLSGGNVNAATGTADNTQGSTDDFKSSIKTIGFDAVVTVNGQTAGADGLDVNYSANGLSLQFTLSENFGSGVVDTSQNAAQNRLTTFTIQGSGGATFQLGTTGSTRATIGIDSLASFNLGGGNGTVRLSELKSGGAASLTADPGAALNSIRNAITQVASTRGRIGGFQKFQVRTAVASLQSAQNGLTAAASVIGDTDFAVATAELTRQQILIQSGIALLGIANQQATQILSLL